MFLNHLGWFWMVFGSFENFRFWADFELGRGYTEDLTEADTVKNRMFSKVSKTIQNVTKWLKNT